MTISHRFRLAAALTAATLAASVSASPAFASATTVRVTVTNLQQVGGFSLTPVYFGFHDGGVDFFDVGGMASAGIEDIAETGGFSILAGERNSQQPSTSQGGVAAAPGGAIAGPIEPGETAIFSVDLDPTDNRYAFFASMILPSNDTFIGVDDPIAFELFNDAGVFEPLTISVDGSFVYDAGTEANDPVNGAAFLDGIDIGGGGPGEGSIQQGLSLGDFAMLDLVGGLGLNSEFRDNFIFSSGDAIARITFSEIPLPPAAFLMAAGLAGLGAAGRRRKAAAPAA